MTDSSGTPIYTARDGRISPEGIAERAFTQVKRGYAESEVRAFLRMVADEVAAIAARERDYAGRIQHLEARLAQPPQLSDQDLIAALGEETARVLGQARESAAELRAKAEEHARRVVREAQESARELRTSTQQAVETKTREAEEAARTRGREIVAEARTLRERVLSDMTERRADLERQIGELRSSRSALVDVYQLVERTLEQATRTIAQEPPLPRPPIVEPVESVRSDDDRSADDASEGDEESGDEAPEPPPVAHDAQDATVAVGAVGAVGESAPADGRDVGALFDRLRSGAAAVEPGASDAADAADAADEAGAGDGAVAVEPETAAVSTAGGSPAADDDATAAFAADVVPPIEELGSVADELSDADAAADAAARATRDDALAPITDDLGRKAKRALQDEQNDVLDGLRRQRGRIDAGKVLPPAQDQLNRWAHVLQPAVDGAYAAGGAAVAPGSGSPDATVPDELLTELTASVVSPLRDRLETSLGSIDARNPADAEIAIAQSLGARYREWRSQGLDEALGDALAVAYARGQYDAAPRGARLRWVPARVGKCPDCDDNALEPTTRGAAFPTGQQYPPAHPGCRCFLVVAAD
jgi:DivIVA domain-containing protein